MLSQATSDEIITVRFCEEQSSDLPRQQQKQNEAFSKNSCNKDDVIEFNVHKSVLTMVSEPFRKMVTGPFKETVERVVKLPREDASYFDPIINHFYAQPIDLGKFHIRFPLCADNWNIKALYNDYFKVIHGRTDIDFVEKYTMCYQIMSKLKLPSKFGKFISKAFGMYIQEFEKKLGMGVI